MNKTEVVAQIANQTGVTKKDAAAVLDAIFDPKEGIIVSALQDKKDPTITFTGCGTFRASQRAEKAGRNPQTGEAITIKAQITPTFKTGKSLKESLN